MVVADRTGIFVEGVQELVDMDEALLISTRTWCQINSGLFALVSDDTGPYRIVNGEGVARSQ